MEYYWKVEIGCEPNQYKNTNSTSTTHRFQSIRKNKIISQRKIIQGKKRWFNQLNPFSLH